MEDYDLPNIYHHPEKYGLTVVAELHYTEEAYEFDTRVVWKTKDHLYVTARDSGCSCPVPFERFKSVQDLDRLNIQDLESEIRNNGGRDYLPRGFTGKAMDFLATVKKSMSLE